MPKHVDRPKLAVSRVELSRILREAREKTGLSQSTVSKRLGMTKQAVMRIELMERGVSEKELAQLCEFYKIPHEVLYE